MANYIGKAGQQQIIDTLTKRLTQYLFEVTVTAWSKLVLMDSPGINAPVVLTGRYRSNWVIGVGTPNVSTPGKGGTPQAPSMPPTMPPSLPALQLGQVVYLTNSVPYARRLEHGWSAKAPSGVVGPVVADLQAQGLGDAVQAVVQQAGGL
jgi:hypothetical protein